MIQLKEKSFEVDCRDVGDFEGLMQRIISVSELGRESLNALRLVLLSKLSQSNSNLMPLLHREVDSYTTLKMRGLERGNFT